MPKFSVIDSKTGKEPDCEEIALHEDWAKGLIYCDMEGFAIQEDSTLILMDECGKFVYCPENRFIVITLHECPAIAERDEARKALMEIYKVEVYLHEQGHVTNYPTIVYEQFDAAIKAAREE